METKIETKQQDLFKITTIKKKHAEQIRDTYIHRDQWDFSEVEVLGFIDTWSAVLVKDANGHFRVKPGTLYSDWLMRKEGLDGTAAYHKMHELPQLFLD